MGSMRLEDKTKAIQLRKSGFSYNEIRAEIPKLSKSTISNWLNGVELSAIQKERIVNKMKNALERGRIKGAWSNQKKRQNQIQEIQGKAEKEFEELSQYPLFSVGVALYFAEGSHKFKRFQFTNSNDLIIRLMLKWLREICKITDDEITLRLYIHEIYSYENCEEYWSNITRIPKNMFLKTIYKPAPHKLKKNPYYKGCLKIEVRGSELYWKVHKWQNMLECLL